MIKDRTFRVTSADLACRLDRFVSGRFPAVSRSLIADAVNAGRILLNGSQAQKSAKLKAGDTVLIQELFEKTDLRVRPNNEIPLDVIFEDESIIVLNKPAGIPVHPIKPSETGTLANGLVARYPGLARVGDSGAPLFPSFVHRLDNDTSGVIVAAKDQAAYIKLREEFRARRVDKTYMALVHGDVNAAGKLDNYLAHDPKDDRRMTVAPYTRGSRSLRRAITYYKPVKRRGETTLLEVKIKTGVMHQIRCQLARIGHPVVGDRIYGKRSSRFPTRHLLHAARIGFVHPRTGARVEFSAGTPNDMERATNS